MADIKEEAASHFYEVYAILERMSSEMISYCNKHNMSPLSFCIALEVLKRASLRSLLKNGSQVQEFESTVQELASNYLQTVGSDIDITFSSPSSSSDH